MAPTKPSSTAIDWLLASDPSIRWQTMRDVLDEPEATWSAERRKVETEGWGALLLSHQDRSDGQWAGGAFSPRGFTRAEWQSEGQPWTATSYALSQLREFGWDVSSAAEAGGASSERAAETVRLVGENSRWDHAGEPFWQGETEECINGRCVADGAYLGVDMAPLVRRLLGERQADDGGWNCERAEGSVKSSFDSTLNVLEGLLEYERATGDATPEAVREARRDGEEYLLKRGLFRRLTTGQIVDEDYLRFVHPNRWRYDVLWALDYFRSASILTGTKPDERLKEAVEHVRSKQLGDGRWALDRAVPGRVWFDVNDGVGQPSPWVTLRALRVLKWWDEHHP